MVSFLLAAWTWDTLNVEGVPQRFFSLQEGLYLITSTGGTSPSVYIYTKDGESWSLLVSYAFQKPLVKVEVYNGDIWFWLNDPASALFVRQISPGQLDTVAFSYTEKYKGVLSFWVDSTESVGLILYDTSLPYGYYAVLDWNGSSWVEGDSVAIPGGIDTDGRFGKSLFFGGRGELGQSIVLVSHDTAWHLDTVHAISYSSGDYAWSPVCLKIDPQGNPTLFHTMWVRYYGFVYEYNWIEEGEWRTSYADFPIFLGRDSWDFDSRGNPWFLGLNFSDEVWLLTLLDGQLATIEHICTGKFYDFGGIAFGEGDTFHVLLAYADPNVGDDTLILYGYGVPQGVEESLASPSLSLVPLLGPNLAFKLSVPKPGLYSLELYDGGGRLVRKLFEGELTPGWHRMSFRARLPKGVYFLRLSGEGLGAVKRLVVP